jgi:SAM-dependent methyltransferase
MIKTAENAAYEKEFKLMRTEAPALVSRKIGPSLHQSAQMIGVITSVLGPGSRLLSAGSFEDVPTEVFTKAGVSVVGVDPVLNSDLHTYRMNNLDKRFDVIFSTSVIEHVQNDEEFVIDIAQMLKPGGFAFITCDFKPGYKDGDLLPATCVRLYTKERLLHLADIVKQYDCKLTQKPEWDITDEELDFEWDDVKYCFMGMSFRKDS